MFGFSKPQVPTVDASEVKEALDHHADVIVLDVRTPGEYSRGKIQNSINVPLDEIPSAITKKIPDSSSKIYVYCMSGSRSAVAVEALLKMGYVNAMDMKSGLLSWRAKGFPLSA